MTLIGVHLTILYVSCAPQLMSCTCNYCMCVCVYYTHHTPKGTVEEVKNLFRDGGRACKDESDTPSKGFLHFVKDEVIPK